MLRLVLPKGSLERATLDLFAEADLGVHRGSDVDYSATIDDPRIASVRILRPQEIPTYVADGLFDLGITGRDWIEETGADVMSLGELAYSKETDRPIKLVLAVAAASAVQGITDLKEGVRVSTEYPNITARALATAGVAAPDIRLSYGATEAKVPDIADAVVEITETGRALAAAGLRVVEVLLESRTELVANRDAAADPVRRAAMDEVHTLLAGVLEARAKVLVKLNVDADHLGDVMEALPSLRSPTVSELAGGGAYAIETVVEKDRINVLIPELKRLGATDILEIGLAKIVH